MLSRIKDTLNAITSESVTDHDPTLITRKWCARKLEFQAACRDGAASWGQFLTSVVKNGFDQCGGDASLSASDQSNGVSPFPSPEFQLGHLPEFVGAIQTHLESVVGPTQELVGKEVQGLIERYFDAGRGRDESAHTACRSHAFLRLECPG